MQTQDFDYSLPKDLIAQVPLPSRDQSRLLVFTRFPPTIRHHQFRDLPGFLSKDDLLVFNNSKVLRARLHAVHPIVGTPFEILLLNPLAQNRWWCMVRPGKRARVHTQLTLLDRENNRMPITARVAEINESGHRQLVFEGTPNIEAELDRLGEIPLPPYISRPSPVETDANRYQTVYCATAGSVAAPTAGLHFTPALLESLQSQGVELAFVTLHVGAGTFSPIKVNEVQDHRMHPERYQISEGTAAQVNSARAHGKRIVAVGTTTLRLLESAVEPESGRLRAGPGETSIFIYPPRDFKMVDALLTNFHLPCSTLLILASAFASPGRMEGRDLIMRVYAEAIRERYRFYSYGDAMLIQ